MISKTDEELVQEIKEGNIAAFEEIVRRYQQRLAIFVYHILNDQEEAEDIVSQSLFKLYKTIERVDINRKFSTYVYQIAKNEAISYLRGKKFELSIADLELIDEDETVFERLIKADQRRTVHDAISKIDKKYRRVIQLYYFDELSYEEIGAKLTLPINTVRTHLRRARETLKEILKQ